MMPRLSERASAAREQLFGRVDRAAYLTGRGLGRLDLLARRFHRTWLVLGILILADWLVIADVARIAAHRGWLFYDGGDNTWYFTSAWVLAHGHIPLSSVGYAYSLLIAPLTWITGSNLLVGLPPILILNAAVLSPIALLSVYGIAKAIGGLRFAYASALLWVVFPLAAIRYFYPTYHSRYVDDTLPSGVGLTALADFPSMVGALVAAYFTYRALSSRSSLDGLAAGLAAGLIIGVKPANALFLPAALFALALARRARQLVLFGAGVAPSLLALALWKYRGLGTLPLFSAAPGQQATLADGLHSPLPVASLPLHFGKYLNLDWSHFLSNIDGLREFGWSERLVIWLALAGLLGLARRSLPGAVLVGGWLGCFLVGKGSDPLISVNGGNFFTHLLPAAPAFFLLATCVVFLIPVYGRRRLLAAATEAWPKSVRSRRGATAVLGFLAIVPVGIFGLLPPLSQPSAADGQLYDVYIPAGRFPLVASVEGGGVSLSWPRQATNGTWAPYFVFRSAPGGDLPCTPVPHAASRCVFDASMVGDVLPNNSTFLDRPPPGRWSYRVALAASATGPSTSSEPLMLSSPALVTVGR
jgi:hypothetical protein